MNGDSVLANASKVDTVMRNKIIRTFFCYQNAVTKTLQTIDHSIFMTTNNWNN